MNLERKKGVIVAGDPVTAKAGQEVLNAGGNAFDASVAAAFTSFAAESTLTSIGGGGFCMAKTKDNSPVVYDFFCQTPQKRAQLDKLDFYDILVNFSDSTQKFHIGLGTSAVPGNVAGLLGIHNDLGRMPLSEVLAPAIRYAKEGVTVTPYILLNFHIVSEIILAEQPSRAIYKPGNNLLKLGEKYRLPEYADFLQGLISEGSDLFYRGEIANSLVKDMEERGGFITHQDLTDYEVIKRKPLRVNYRDYDFLTNPPPGSGGILIAFTLQLLERSRIQEYSFGSKEHLDTLIKSLEITADARRTYLNSKHHSENLISDFLNSEMLDDRGQALGKYSAKFPNTTHISVQDGIGNISSITTSFGTGNGYNIPGTDSMMNNMLGEEDLNPDGFHLWPFNQRMTSMMSPSIIMKGDSPCMILGSGGANRIRTAILQAIVNYIDLGLNPSDAINLPRIHWEDNVLSYEPGYDPKIIEKLDGVKNWKVDPYQDFNMFFGGVQTIFNDSGQVIGAGDRRREGAVLYEE